jgi:hypothetical protein
MLRLAGGQVESLFDQLLPVEVRELPEDLAALDRLLADRRLLAPIEQAWECTARGHGRPTIPMACFVRLMVVNTAITRAKRLVVLVGSRRALPRRSAPTVPGAAGPPLTGGSAGAPSHLTRLAVRIPTTVSRAHRSAPGSPHGGSACRPAWPDC